MASNTIDGNAISKAIKEEIQTEVAQLKAEHSVVPGLGVLLVGGRADSATYVRLKQRAAEALGMHFRLVHLEDSVDEETVVSALNGLIADDSVHGIIVQVPLPAHINETRVASLVPLEKDVDGFHILNMGALAMRGKTPRFLPCTPAGVIELLKRSGVEISGKDAVVLGRSNIVGTPVSLLLLENDATVTICHSRTKDLAEKVRRADIVVAALGKPRFVVGDWVKEGAVVIDVGIHQIEDASRKSGNRLVGDVDYDSVAPKASLITPVPGGVGPMTVAMLLRNTLRAAQMKVQGQ